MTEVVHPRREYHRKYGKDNAEHIKNRRRKYYEDNREELMQKIRDWQDDNKERVREYQREYGRKKRMGVKK